MFDFTVRPDNGEPWEVTAEARDVVVWEKTSRNGMTLARLMDDLSMAELYRLCHIAARRQQLFTGNLQELEETCNLDFAETDDDADPTRAARSPGSSSASRLSRASRRPSGPKRETKQS
jgi:hypothetical protein